MDSIINAVIGAIVVIGGLLGVWFFGKSAGKTKAETQAKSENADIKVATAQKTAEQETGTLEKVNHVQSEVNKAGVDAIADGMRDKYTRDQINS